MISVCFIDISSLSRTKHFLMAGLVIPLLHGVVNLELSFAYSRKVVNLSLDFMRLLVLCRCLFKHMLFNNIIDQQGRALC